MADLATRLQALDSCAVSDALDRLHLAGVADGVVPLGGAGRVSGRVVTVELGPPTGRPPGAHLGARAVEASGPGDVLVVAHQGRTDCAGWGGNLSRAAQQRGIVGTIVHGAVRDVDESWSIGYPVFGTAATPRTARGRAEEQAWGGTVSVGPLAVATGDYVVADGTGVVFVRAADAEAVIGAAEEIATKEARMAAAIGAGTPVTEVMGRSYEQMLEEESPA